MSCVTECPISILKSSISNTFNVSYPSIKKVIYQNKIIFTIAFNDIKDLFKIIAEKVKLIKSLDALFANTVKDYELESIRFKKYSEFIEVTIHIDKNDFELFPYDDY